METVRIPGPMRIFWGSVGCYWLAGIINPGFYAIALLFLLMIPVIIVEKYFSQSSSPKKPA